MSALAEDRQLTGSDTRLSRVGFWLSSAICLLAYAGLALIDWQNGTLRADQTPRSIVFYVVAFVGFGLAAWSNERRPFDRRWLWLLPIGFRVLMLTTEPTLSDDVHRYLWDGHLVAEGVNPYSHQINAAELDPFEIPARRSANNPTLSSPYLPVAQGVFGAAAAVAPSKPITMQILMTGFDLASALLVSGLLAAAGLPRRRVLLYLWNPLIIVETAHGAHLDALMIFLALGATSLAFKESRARVGSPIALAGAVLTRPIPALLAPVLWWRWTGVQRALFVAVGAALIIPFGFGPSGFGLSAEPTGTGVFGSARIYSRDFRFNAGLARWSEELLGTGPTNALVAVLMAAVLLTTWALAHPSRSGGRDESGERRRLLRLMAVPVAAYVLLTPVFHPWYLTLLLTVLVFVPPAEGEGGDRWVLLAPWFFLAAASPLSYLTYRDPDAFGELDWVRTVEWFPTLALLVFTSFWVFFAVQAESPRTAQPSRFESGSS